VRTQGEFSIFARPSVIVLLTLTFTLFLSSNLWNTVIPGGWSIQSEVFHYGVFALIRKFRRKSVIFFLSALSFSSLVIEVLLKSNHFGSICPKWVLGLLNAWMRLNIFSTLMYFFLGIVFYHLLNEGIEKLRIPQLELGLVFLIGISTIALPLAIGTNIEALGYLLVMVLLSYAMDPESRISKLIQKIGKYSYFIYFFHVPVLYLFFSLGNKPQWHTTSSWLQIPLFIVIYLLTNAICLFAGRISYEYFERPILRLAHKI